MKNRFLSFLLLGLALFSACSSSDDDNGDPRDLNGVYEMGTTRDLDLKYSNAVLIGKSVEFKSVDGETATLQLNGVVPGEEKTIFTGILLNNAGGTFSFTGENKTGNRVVIVEGRIEKGKLTIGVNAVFTSHALMGKWNLDEDAIYLKWEPTNETMFTLNIAGMKVPVTPQMILSSLPEINVMVRNYLQDITFGEDGNVVATYNAAQATEGNSEPAAVWKTSPLNLAYYVFNGELCRIYPNLEMIMQEIDLDEIGRASNPQLDMINQLLVGGVPMTCILEGNKVTMFINEVFINRFTSVFPLLGTLFPEDKEIELSVSGMKVAVKLKDILDQLEGALGKTTKLEIGLNLVKATDAK